MLTPLDWDSPEFEPVSPMKAIETCIELRELTKV
ncbi:hypothetical protein BGP_6222 [Beggiatoa sp. PS]|nr:hypothetical protein BGP_6222 [Beggiatoa sp. PS]